MTYTTPKYFLILCAATLLLAGCASQYIRTGKEAHADLRYQDAIWSLEKGLSKKDNPEARRLLAESYLMVNDYRNAADQYAHVALYNDNTDSDRILMGKALMANGRYAEAREVFEGVISRDPLNKVAASLLQSCKKMDEMKRDSLLIMVEPVNIPTELPVYSATPFKDGLIITSPASKGDMDPYTNRAFTDLYFTRKQGASWTAPEPIEAVNGPFHDAVAVVSPNGQHLVLTRSFQLKGGKLAGDDQNVSNTQLYGSHKDSNGNWGPSELLPFCHQKYMFAHPAFSPDGNTLYFSSNMSGSGKMDLFQVKMSDGSWGLPVNLGTDINTPGNEVFPTVRGDGRLYFSSDAHNTLGGFDILYTDPQNGQWSLPKHVTYPINSSSDDFGMQWNADGKSGYFSSDRSGMDRIYSFSELNPIITIQGLVLSKEKSSPIVGARVTIQNLTDGSEKTIFTDKEGKYSHELEPGKDYKLRTEADGYFSVTEDVSTKGIVSNKTIQKVTELSEVVVTDTADGSGKNGNSGNNGEDKGKKSGDGIYPINNIYWDYNKADIRPDAIPFLEDVVKIFRDNQNLRFEIHSHCDCRGSDAYNDDLSQRRAKAVLEYLVDRGVPRSIIKSRGYGKRQLFNHCDCAERNSCSEELHQENRRTEFIVTKNTK